MNMEENEPFICPYCAESNDLMIDLSGGNFQEFVVDCEVCCAPILIRLKINRGRIVSLDIKKENE